jgi:hypothetical protein
MANELVLFDTSFNVKNNFLLNYLYASVKSNRKTFTEKFIFCFTELYRIPVLRPLLNAILTKAKHKKAIFKLELQESWNNTNGYCETSIEDEERNDNVLKNGMFSEYYKIVIKKIVPDTIIHEIGHAIERVSKIDIHREFKEAITSDFKFGNTHPPQIQLRTAVGDIMVDRVKKYYKPEQAMQEVFARFFQMLAISKEVGGWGEYVFTYDEVSAYFANTIRWTNSILIPILKKNTDSDVEDAALTFVDGLKPFKKKWVTNNASRFADVKDMNNKWAESLSLEGRWVGEEYANKVMDVFEKKETSKLSNGVEYFDFSKKK